MIQMEIRVCRLDDLPTTKSNAYKLLRFCLGREIADQLTYTILVPRDDPG